MAHLFSHLREIKTEDNWVIYNFTDLQVMDACSRDGPQEFVARIATVEAVERLSKVSKAPSISRDLVDGVHARS